MIRKQDLLPGNELLPATVISIANDSYHVRTASFSQVLKTKKAFSCLIEPQKDDRVLIAPLGEDFYIIAILERQQTQPCAIHLTQPIQITAPSIHIITKQHELECSEAQFKINRARWIGHELNFDVQYFKVIAKCIEKICDTLQTQSIRFYQWIEDLQHQVVGQLRTIVHDNYRIDCHELDICSEEDTKINAKQIHLG